MPQTVVTPSPAPPPPPRLGCLCLFDVDRTLTAKQGAKECPGVQLKPNVQDTAFGGGPLTLSQVGQNPRTGECTGCKIGVISAGSAGFADEKVTLDQDLGVSKQPWSGPNEITAPLVTGCVDEKKPQCAEGIVKWYMDHEHTQIPADEVYFFDDSQHINIDGFAQRGYNAHQISCASRDSSMNGAIGLCGATIEEIAKRKGTSMCQ